MTTWTDQQFEPQPYNSLTKRQRQIALMVCDGISNKQIARQLRLSEGTVKIHLFNIFRKLGISNRASLVRLTLSARE